MTRLRWVGVGALATMGASLALVTVLAWLAEREDEALYRAERLDPSRPPTPSPIARYGRSYRG